MYKTKLEIVFFSKTKEKSIVGAGSSFREREREFLLSRFAAVRTVGSRRSKK